MSEVEQGVAQLMPEDVPRSDAVEESARSENNAPSLPLWTLFTLFLGHGIRAWGGPVAHIAALREHFVIQEKWITVDRFQRVLAVYQVLPGPEATELCCYFGMMSRGRPGSVVAGAAFVLPGFLLTLLCSWLYATYGLVSPVVIASFRSIQPAVVAMVVRAVHRIGEGAVKDHSSGSFSWALFVLVMISCVQSVANINFFLSLLYCGAAYAFFAAQRWVGLGILTAASLAAYVLYEIYALPSDGKPFGSNLVAGRNPGSMLLLGLLAGMVTFGGAYTAIPLVEHNVVGGGGWMTDRQFLDGLAITAMLPAPTVVFVTFVGFLGSSWLGSIAMTIGMFAPAFSFTLVGHNFFEKIIDYPNLSKFLDGVTASVVGFIAVTALSLLKVAVTDHYGAMIFIMSLGTLYHFKHRMTPVIVVAASALAGQILYQGPS